MKSKPRPAEIGTLASPLLRELISPRHELVLLAQLIDWDRLEESWSRFFTSRRGRPATPPHLVAGLLYLQHSNDLSDRAVVNFLENPHWQHFCGLTYYDPKFSINPSTLTHWRKRIGKEGVEEMLSLTVEAAQKCGALKPAELECVAVDTTVMEKTIAYPRDSKLVEDARRLLVRLAEAEGLSLRRNYNRVGPRLARSIGQYVYKGNATHRGQAVEKHRDIVWRVRWRCSAHRRIG